MSINRYGVEAHAYWRRWLPERCAGLSDPTAFFTSLGELVEQQVGDLWNLLILEDEVPGGETHEQRVGRLGLLKAEAEHHVLQELVRLPPEPEAAPADDGADGPRSGVEHRTRVHRTRERTERLAHTADDLVDGAVRLDDLSDPELSELIACMTPSFLRLFGTSVEDQRARGRRI
ncbi:hypothetical protein [Streptomyces sp. RFCAC02]|uniref:hypothetical protein n=1 Tax=Streptomyces sp. RFCAC02 TaxID=2499143 RepID=UPI001F0F4793|nr:hypothetical protein [Streptomyces sp. RFCAC02]